jgi:hypothetical protein
LEESSEKLDKAGSLQLASQCLNRWKANNNVTEKYSSSLPCQDVKNESHPKLESAKKLEHKLANPTRYNHLEETTLDAFCRRAALKNLDNALSTHFGQLEKHERAGDPRKFPRLSPRL